MSKSLRITVLLGGVSAERDVSLSSGLRIAMALREKGHEVICLDPAEGVLTRETERSLLASGVGSAPPSLEALAGLESRALSPVLGTLPELTEADCLFLALHGGQGEDGTIQALLDMVGVPYTGSGHLARPWTNTSARWCCVRPAWPPPTGSWRRHPTLPKRWTRTMWGGISIGRWW